MFYKILSNFHHILYQVSIVIKYSQNSHTCKIYLKKLARKYLRIFMPLRPQFDAPFDIELIDFFIPLINV